MRSSQVHYVTLGLEEEEIVAPIPPQAYLKGRRPGQTAPRSNIHRE